MKYSKLEDVIRYTLEEALSKLIEFKHFGPWTDTHTSKFPAYCPWFGTSEDYPTLSREEYHNLVEDSYLIKEFCHLKKALEETEPKLN